METLGNLAVALPAILLVLLFLFAAIKILREYERGVIFTLGRFTGVKGPGLILLIPFVQQMVRMDLRTLVLDVPTQDVISRDNVSVRVNAVIYFRVIDPERATIQVRTSCRRPASWRRRRCARCSASTSSTRCSPSATS
jgi:regulator of protease activity HflC (stomatin/prohibitin superfamily)